MENNNINNNDNNVVEVLYKTIINNEPKTDTYSKLTQEINGLLGFKFEKVEIINDNNNK